MKSKVREGHYYVIQWFMVHDLKLKGLELSCYAIIYGFTQADGQVFNGSLQYLCDWTGASKQAVIKALNRLVEKKYLIREEKFINGVKFVEYYATNLNTIKKSLMGWSTKFNGGGQQT